MQITLALKTGFIVTWLIFAAVAGAQEKVEKERRVHPDEVPVLAVEWVDDTYQRARKTRWYYEETSGLQSFEAKLNWKGRMHSVEFDTTGVVQDIEISIQWEDLPETVQDNLAYYLDSAFQKKSIKKIQAQWTGAPDELKDLIEERKPEDLTKRYEIEYYGKNERFDELWEGLFDADGRMLRVRVIKLRPTDNLNF